MLSIRNFEKKYFDRTILAIDEMDFSPGIHWIKGENGSGKTTLFRSVAGLIPAKGSFTIAGAYSIRKDRPSYLQRLGYAEAEPLFPGFLTPQDIVAFTASARNISESEVSQSLNIFNITDFYDMPLSACSSGMVKKVSLTLAFMGTKNVIVLDEPYVTLDAAAQQALSTHIERPGNSSDVTFLISSHQELPHTLPVAKYVIEDKTLKRL